MVDLMNGFPPDLKQQVTFANWRTPPFNKWAFHHVREIVPSANIANDPEAVWQLNTIAQEMTELRIPGVGDQQLSWHEFLEQTHSDGLVILHQGNLIYETYANGLTEYTPHILMSVSKSLLGLLSGILAGQGVIDPAGQVTDYVPELAKTAYAGSMVQHLLDMRAGVQFNEDYLATSGPLVEYRKATNWDPLEQGEAVSDLRSFYQALTAADGKHGQRFHYVSPNTDLLAWIIERAAGQRFNELLSQYLWQPLGAERNAYITVDRLGAPRPAGGICVTVRDLARLGQLLIQDGQRGNRQIIPTFWIEDMLHTGSAQAWAEGSFVEYFPGLPIRYRSQWYVLDDAAPLLFGLGIHGQNLFVDQANAIVIAKVSSQPLPLDPELNSLMMRAVAAIRCHLTQHTGGAASQQAREGHKSPCQAD